MVMKWDGMGSGREGGGEMQVVGEREMREQGHWDC